MESRKKRQDDLEFLGCEEILLSCWMNCIGWWIADDENPGKLLKLFSFVRKKFCLFMWKLCIAVEALNSIHFSGSEEDIACTHLHLQRLFVRRKKHCRDRETGEEELRHQEELKSRVRDEEPLRLRVRDHNF